MSATEQDITVDEGTARQEAAEDVAADEAPTTYQITTTGQVEAVYEVQGETYEQALGRLRVHIKDAAVLAEGVVNQTSLLRSTPERIKPTPKPKTAETPPAPNTEDMPL